MYGGNSITSESERINTNKNYGIIIKITTLDTVYDHRIPIFKLASLQIQYIHDIWYREGTILAIHKKIDVDLSQSSSFYNQTTIV